MAVAAGLILHEEAHAGAQGAAGVGVGRLVAWADDDAELLDAGAGGLLQNYLQGGFGFAVLIDQGLQRQRALAGIGGGDEDFADSHGRGNARATTVKPSRSRLKALVGGFCVGDCVPPG